MNKMRYNTALLCTICMVIAAIIITSCKKDKLITSDKIELLSFGPTGAKHGDTLTFIGNNLNTVTDIVFTGVSAIVPESSFLQQTSEVILVIVPQAAEQGFVTLKTPQGDIVSKTQLNLDVMSTIASMTAQARPGDNITITGTYLNWVKRITFAKDKAVDSFVSKTEMQIVVTVPTDAHTGTLVVSYGGTKPMDIETTDTLKVTLPSITSISPNPIKHANNLTITGANLDLATGIIFNGVDETDTAFVSHSATQIVFKIPAGVKQGKIMLIGRSGVKVESGDELGVVLPSIASLSPNPVDRLSNLTITGNNLDLVTSILFNADSLPVTSFVSQSATTLVVQAPATAKKGKIVLSVLNSTLTVQSADILSFVGDPPPLAPLAYAMYIDDLQNGWQDWGWNRTIDYTNTENVRDGAASIKMELTGQWGGLKFANSSVTTASYTEFTFSLYGTPGTGGKKLNVVPSGGSTYTITIQEGQWVEYKLSMADLGNPATITDLLLGNQDWTGLVYIDHIGLR